MLRAGGSGCAPGVTASELFYSPDLEKKRMRCHHPEQRASRQHIPRKPCSHIKVLQLTLRAAPPHMLEIPLLLTTSPGTWLKLLGKSMSEGRPHVETSNVPHLKHACCQSVTIAIRISTCWVDKLGDVCHLSKWIETGFFHWMQLLCLYACLWGGRAVTWFVNSCRIRD